ncbi:FAD-dependent oxidoreductase, partial [Nocardia sp. NPDC058497]|uniref:FAD-dependent oxidoreductase n=1 Tax=Nocardia sp. NPDC058497 TaxID=3346529 RepID=UPI003649F444
MVFVGGGWGPRPPPPRLLSSPAAHNLLADLSTLKSSPLLRVVGGTDLIVTRLSAPIARANRHLRHELTEIVRHAAHVEMTFSTPDGEVREEFDAAIVTVPPHLLSQIDSDFPPEVLAALHVPQPRPAIKVFLTYPQRWWERKLGIFGGTSYPADPVEGRGFPSARWSQAGGPRPADGRQNQPAPQGARGPPARAPPGR